MTRQYEMMVLLAAESTQEQVKSFIQAIEKLAAAKKGSVLSHELLGRRNLAYEIKKKREAYYILFQISMDTQNAQSFEREIRLMDDVMRHLFILHEEKKLLGGNEVQSATVEEEKKEE